MDEQRTSVDTLRIVVLVTDHYLATDGWLSLQEIADRLGWSVSKVRRIFREHFGMLPGLTSKAFDNYDSYGRASRAIDKYAPSRDSLREIILAERAAQK
jgi:AraC-like DNA-binding protein